jgi:large repetitive protein
MLEASQPGIIGNVVTGVNMSGYPAGTYYWRVKAVNSFGAAGKPSAARPFVIDITLPAAAPTQTLPANGAVVNTVRPTFTYTSVTDPSTPITYQVDISTSLTPDFDSNILTNAGSTTTTATLASNLPVQATYYWRVTAYDRAANSRTTGTIRSFTVNISNMPAANAVAAPGNVTFTWLVVPTATAYHVEIDEDGNGDFTNGTITSCNPVTHTATTCTLFRATGTYPWRVVADTPDTLNNAPGNYPVLYVKTGAGLPAPTNVHLDAVSGIVAYDTDIYVNTAEKTGGINVAWNAPPAIARLTVQKYVVEFSPTSAFTNITESVETPDGNTTQALVPASMLTLDGSNKYARVRAVYNPGTASSANTTSFWFVVDTQSLTAPTLLTPALGRGSKVPPKAKLTWSTVTGIAPTNGYLLSVATNFSITTPVLPGHLNRPVTTASYTFPVDLPQGSLFWRVNAVDVAGNISLNSNNGDFMVFLGTAPVHSSTNQPVHPTFTWATITEATGYNLEVARDGDTSFTGDVYSFTTPNATTLSHVYPAAQPALGSFSSIIYWRVYPTGTTPPAGYYASFAVTGGLTAPTLNLGDTAINQSDYSTAQLSWNPPTPSGVYTYHLEVANSPAFTGAVTIGHLTPSNATTLNLSPGMDAQADGLKYWRVRAEYMPGNILGPYSATGTFTLDRNAPAKPTGLKVTFGTNPSRPTLAWTAVTGIAAANGYQIELAEDSGFTTHVTGFPKLVTTPSSAIAAPLSLEQKTYYLMVRAIDAAGNVSPNSDTFSFSVNVAKLPANNAFVNAPTGTVNQVFSWFAVLGATSYQVQIDSDNDGNFLDSMITCPAIGTTTATSCTVPGLARGTYAWRVMVNGNNPAADILRTLFVINGTTLLAPGSVILSETGSIPPYYRDNLVSASEKAAGVNLQWTAPTVVGAIVVAYDVEYSTTLTFASLLATDYGVGVLSTPIPAAVLATDGVKYVRVRARYQTGVGQQPGAFTMAKLFTIDTVAPAVAALSAPTNGQIITTRTPTLTWKAVPGATRYHVEWFPFSNPPTIVDIQVTTTSLIMPNALGLENGIHFWSVTAYDAAGNLGAASNSFPFRVAVP